MDKEKQFDIFVSYAHADSAWVKGVLLSALNDAGVNFFSEETFRLGSPRILEFENAINNSKRILLVLTPAYFSSDFNSFFEILVQSYGLEARTWPIVPLLLKKCDLPIRLRQLVPLDASNPDLREEALEKLLNDLNKPLPPPCEELECPYPGMLPFGTNNNELFFGRSKEVQELLQGLRLSFFKIIIGPSGTGKSSLVFAGLLPALKSSNLFGGKSWIEHIYRPKAFLGKVVDIGGASNSAGHANQLLIIDQFEELFALGDQEQNLLIEELIQLIDSKSIYIVLTMRADFYQELALSKLWKIVKPHRFELDPLDDKELKKAINYPAESKKVEIEAELLERLVADGAGAPGILPFLQETMVLLWDKLERRLLPLRAYEALVISRNSYGQPPKNGLQVAMAKRADAVYDDSLSEEQQLLARRIFVRLVQFGEGRSHTRRQQTVEQLKLVEDEPVEEVLEILTQARLITMSSRADDKSRRVDLAHEALIQGWPRLAAWVEEFRSAEVKRRLYLSRAENWVEHERKGGLLDKAELVQVGWWLEDMDRHEFKVDQVIRDFIGASRKYTKKQSRKSWVLPLGGGVSIILLSILVLSGYISLLRYKAINNNPPIEIEMTEEKTILLDKYEIDNNSYKLCVNSFVCEKPKEFSENISNPSLKNSPVIGVTPLQAEGYCKWLDKKLPTLDEWQIMADKKVGGLWPWENQDDNKYHVHMPSNSELLDTALEVTDGSTKVSNKNIPLHLIGNVWEWVTISKKSTNNSFAIVGGSFMSPIRSLYDFDPVSGTASGIDMGFRCVLENKP